MEHEIEYRPATRGLARFGVPDGEARWVCSRGDWAVPIRITAGRPDRAHGRQLFEQHLAALS